MVAPSQPVAGVAIADRRREEDEAEGQHGEIQHRAAPLRFAHAAHQDMVASTTLDVHQPRV